MELYLKVVKLGSSMKQYKILNEEVRFSNASEKGFIFTTLYLCLDNTLNRPVH